MVDNCKSNILVFEASLVKSGHPMSQLSVPHVSELSISPVLRVCSESLQTRWGGRPTQLAGRTEWGKNPAADLHSVVQSRGLAVVENHQPLISILIPALAHWPTMWPGSIPTESACRQARCHLCGRALYRPTMINLETCLGALADYVAGIYTGRVGVPRGEISVNRLYTVLP